jgi:predicted nucleotidyltransferase
MADLKETARSLVREFAKELGQELRSALLYGSIARGEAVEGLSNINVMLLLDHVDMDTLRRVAPLARKWAQTGNLPPLVLSWEEWERSADSFAIEVADMRDAREVLAGSDPIPQMNVTHQDLRLQAERELKGKLLLLRTRLMLVGEKPEEIGRLLLAALPSFTTYLRAALRLAGRDVARSTPDVIRTGGELIGTDTSALLRVYTARNNKETLRVKLDDPLVVGYYGVAERLEAFVDTFGETT